MTAGITGATRVYLHLAHPSAHARTPQVMNAEFARRGVDAVAVSADVAPGDLGEFARGLRGWRNLAGLSVTMPHKEALAEHADEQAGPAVLIGAVNVVRREVDGRLVAANTDGPGFIIGLREAGHELARRRVLLAGAGGAGRAVAFAVADAGAAHLTIANRTAARAERLARDITTTYPAMTVAAGSPDPAGHDVVVNATSLGMRPGDPLPVRVGKLAPGTLVCDIVTRPERTRPGALSHISGWPRLPCQPGYGGWGTPPPQDGGRGTQPPYHPSPAVTSGSCEAYEALSSREICARALPGLKILRDHETSQGASVIRRRAGTGEISKQVLAGLSAGVRGLYSQVA